MSYNPSKNALGSVLGKCYEEQVSFTSIAQKCGFSSGTASNDRKNPESMPLKRLTMYMAALGIKELTIRLEGDD